MDEVTGVARWAPVVCVVLAFVVVLAGVGILVVVGKQSEPGAKARATTVPASAPIAGPDACVPGALSLFGSRAARVAGAYRLRILLQARHPCLLRPAAVALVATGPDGATHTLAVPDRSVRVSWSARASYVVEFAPACSGGGGTADVRLRVSGKEVAIADATIPASLATCSAVGMTSLSYW